MESIATGAKQAEKLIIEAKRPEELSERDFVGIHEVMQDMWASEEGLGELAQCEDCGKMVSKEEAFRNLPTELVNDTVAQVFRILWTDEIPCTACGGKNTRLIYGSKNIDKIKRRVLSSVDAFVVLCRSEDRGIVGFYEAYIDSIDRMFELDFSDHYGNVGLPEIRRRVIRTLGYLPDELMLMSSLGLLEPYRNFQNLFETMSKFSHAIPDSYLWTPGIAELDRGGVTHRMSAGINHGISLGIEDDPKLRKKMTSVGEKYQCDLIVYPDAVGMHKEHFTKGMKHFLRTSRGPRREQMVSRQSVHTEIRA